MLHFLQNFFRPRARPIGIDFGDHALRVAQISHTDADLKLSAAAERVLGEADRESDASRLSFLTRSLRELRASEPWKGRDVVLAVPSSQLHLRHVRLAPMSEEEIRKVLPFELEGTLPIDPHRSILRHVVVGSGPGNTAEVLAMAVSQESIDSLASAVNAGGFNVLGVHSPCLAIVDCFHQLYRRKADAESVTAYIDLGASGTRMIVAQGGEVRFARTISVGGRQLDAALAASLGCDAATARAQRLTTAAVESPDSESTTPPGADELIAELQQCRRYHDSVFPNRPIDRLIFVGGEAASRSLCQSIARSLQLAAQLGDPIVRLGREGEALPGAIDRRIPQPSWSVAVGLSLGPKVSATAGRGAAHV